MKRILALMLVLSVLSIISEAQVIQGPAGTVFNQATQFYRKSGFITTTDNDTTTWLTFSPAVEIKVFERCNDSAKVAIYYRLRNSQLAYNTAWTLLDSTNVATGTVATMDTIMAISPLAIATTAGYNQIQFYIDYLSGAMLTSISSAGDGTANLYRLYYYFPVEAFKQ